MNIESLGRQAIDRIKSEWGLPLHGFVAGGAIANIVWELVSGNKAVVNDIDIFVFDGIEKELDNNKKTLFNYQEKETKYYEDYSGMNFNNYTKDFYSIVESERDDMFNMILLYLLNHLILMLLELDMILTMIKSIGLLNLKIS